MPGAAWSEAQATREGAEIVTSGGVLPTGRAAARSLLSFLESRSNGAHPGGKFPLGQQSAA
jgi:hypothetical protein